MILSQVWSSETSRLSLHAAEWTFRPQTNKSCSGLFWPRWSTIYKEQSHVKTSNTENVLKSKKGRKTTSGDFCSDLLQWLRLNFWRVTFPAEKLFCQHQTAQHHSYSNTIKLCHFQRFPFFNGIESAEPVSMFDPDLGWYWIWLNIAIFATTAIFFHNIKYPTAATASLCFYFEKKMHAELWLGGNMRGYLRLKVFHRLVGTIQSCVQKFRN